METWVIVLIVLVIILILGCGICYCIIRKKSKKEEKIEGGETNVRCPNMILDYGNDKIYAFQYSAFKEKEKVINVLLKFLNNYDFINIVTVCPPHEFIIDDLKPVIFVDPMGFNATDGFDPVKEEYCQFKIRSEDLFNYVNGNAELNDKIKQKVKIFHIDFGTTGSFYLNRDHLEKINNQWMAKDGIFSSNNCNFRILFNITEQYFTAYVDNKEEHVQCLFDIFDAYIPDYQKLEDNPFVFAKEYINGSPIMTEENKYYDYLDYVIYNAENYNNNTSMKTEFLRAWSLDDTMYKEILNVRKNLNNAESVCAQLCYIMDSSSANYTALMYDYLNPSSGTYESFKSEYPPSKIKELLDDENLNKEVQEEINKIIKLKHIGTEIKISTDIYKLLLMFCHCENYVISDGEHLKFIDNCDDYIKAMGISEEDDLWDITKNAIKFILSDKTLDDITVFVQSLNNHRFRGKYFPELIRSLISKSKIPDNTDIDDEVISKLKACIELFGINADKYLYSVFGIATDERGNQTIIEKFEDIVHYYPRAIKQFIMVPKNRVMK